MNPCIDELMDTEEGEKLYEPETTARFAADVQARRARLFDAVHERARAGKKVIGIGAPAKASTVCNYCRLGPEMIEYMTEVNELRIGKFLPGVRIPIVDEERMFTDARRPDAAVLFAWNYHNEIVPRLRKRGFDGEILLP